MASAFTWQNSTGVSDSQLLWPGQGERLGGQESVSEDETWWSCFQVIWQSPNPSLSVFWIHPRSKRYGPLQGSNIPTQSCDLSLLIGKLTWVYPRTCCRWVTSASALARFLLYNACRDAKSIKKESNSHHTMKVLMATELAEHGSTKLISNLFCWEVFTMKPVALCTPVTKPSLLMFHHLGEKQLPPRCRNMALARSYVVGWVDGSRSAVEWRVWGLWRVTRSSPKVCSLQKLRSEAGSWTRDFLKGCECLHGKGERNVKIQKQIVSSEMLCGRFVVMILLLLDTSKSLAALANFALIDKCLVVLRQGNKRTQPMNMRINQKRQDLQFTHDKTEGMAC